MSSGWQVSDQRRSVSTLGCRSPANVHGKAPPRKLKRLFHREVTDRHPRLLLFGRRRPELRRNERRGVPVVLHQGCKNCRLGGFQVYREFQEGLETLC